MCTVPGAAAEERVTGVDLLAAFIGQYREHGAAPARCQQDRWSCGTATSGRNGLEGIPPPAGNADPWAIRARCYVPATSRGGGSGREEVP
jgi:hypothetical protein